jgi:hypothetical protein
MSRSVRCLLFFSVAALVSFLLFPQWGEAKSSSCVACHTDDQTLKALHKPLKAVVSEEGEG